MASDSDAILAEILVLMLVTLQGHWKQHGLLNHVLLENCTEHSDVILYVKRPILLSCDLMILFFVLKYHKGLI